MLSDAERKHINKLQQKKYRYEFAQYIVEGVKGVKEALAYTTVASVIVEGNRREEPALADIISIAEEQGIEVLFAGTKDIAKIKTTATFPGVLAIVSLPENDIEDMTGPIILLEAVNDPGNLGTIIRTADWFGIKNILLSEGSVDPYNDKVVRSTMGSLFRANIVQSDNIQEDIAWLKETQGYTCAGLVMDGDDISGMKPHDKMCYVFGNESRGISEQLEKFLDQRYTIAGKGEAESLNLGVAVGVVLNYCNE